MHMSQAHLPVCQSYPLCFSSAVTAFWFLILCHVKPKTSFWSTVLQLECERRAWQEGNRKMNYRLLKLIWKPGDKLIHRLSLKVLQFRNGCVTFRVLLTKSYCINMCVWAFRIITTEKSLNINDLLTVFFFFFLIGIVKKIKHKIWGTQRHCGVLCFAAIAVQKCISWSLFVQKWKQTNLNDSKWPSTTVATCCLFLFILLLYTENIVIILFWLL